MKYWFKECFELAIGTAIATTGWGVAGWGFYRFCLLLLMLALWALLIFDVFDDESKLDQAEKCLKNKANYNLSAWLTFFLAIYFAAQNHLFIAVVMTVSTVLWSVYRLAIVAVVQAMTTEVTNENN